jgi:hypothetical protein
MKRKYTKVKADGSKEMVEIHDEAPSFHKNLTATAAASQGHGGDTELAHVNSWEAQLLKRLGGSGTRNPHTGLKQFTNAGASYYEDKPAPDQYGYYPTPVNLGPSYLPDPYEQMPVGPSTGFNSSDTFGNAYFSPQGPKPTIPNNTYAPPGSTGQDWSLTDREYITDPISYTNTPPPPNIYDPGEYTNNPNGGNRYADLLAKLIKLQGLASQGQFGDNRLARVNRKQERILERLGGVGTRNPRTGLKQFYTTPVYGVADWYRNAFGREGSATPGQGIDYWSNYSGENPWQAFLAAASPTDTAAYLGWTPDNPINSAWDPTPTPDTGLPDDNIDIPLDIFPSSTSNSSSYTGLPGGYSKQLLATLMPQLQNAITNMPGNIDQYTNQALGSYQQTMQNALRNNIPTALSGLANRGILSSTEGNKVLSDVISNAAMGASDKGYQTAMQAALLKANMPSVLAQIGELGKTSGTTSSSYYSDPTVMYRAMVDLIRNMQG